MVASTTTTSEFGYAAVSSNAARRRCWVSGSFCAGGTRPHDSVVSQMSTPNTNRRERARSNVIITVSSNLGPQPFPSGRVSDDRQDRSGCCQTQHRKTMGFDDLVGQHSPASMVAEPTAVPEQDTTARSLVCIAAPCPEYAEARPRVTGLTSFPSGASPRSL
jgi:hypothetical protein